MTFRRLLLSATASISILAAAPSAWAAVEAQKVADAIVQFYANNGMTITVAGAESDGENVILKGVSFKPPAKDAKQVDIGDITLENVTEGDKGFVAAQVNFAAREIDGGEGTGVKFGGAVIKNLSIPVGGDANSPLSNFMLAESFEISKSVVTAKGVEVFSMDSGIAHYSPLVEGRPLTFDASFNGLHGDLSTLSDPMAKQTVADLGLTKIDGQITMKGSWNMADGRINLSEYAFDFANIGKLNLQIDLSGYTPAFIKQMQDMSKSMQEKQGEAQSMAMMGLVQQLTFNSFSIRFDDASIANKVIDYAAKQAGQPREAVLAQAKGMVPFMLMQLQDAEFATAVSGAVTAFLDNPKNIEIKAAPAAGLSFAVLAATGMSTPAALIKQLGVTVTANQ